MEEREIDLFELWDEIVKNWFFIILTGIILFGLTFAINKFVLPEKYKAETTMIVGKPKEIDEGKNRIEYNEILVNQKLVSTYSEIMKSKSISDRVIQNLQLNLEVEEFSKKLDISSVKDTEVISLTVTDTIPERARDIANETADIFKNSIKEIMNVDNVQILDPAYTPEKPSQPKIKRNSILGSIIGVGIAILYILIKNLLDNSVKTVEQIQKEFGLPVLAMIPQISKEVNNGKKP